LFNSGDDAELLEKICMLLENPVLYKKIADNARKKALRFSNLESLKSITINIVPQLQM